MSRRRFVLSVLLGLALGLLAIGMHWLLGDAGHLALPEPAHSTKEPAIMPSVTPRAVLFENLPRAPETPEPVERHPGLVNTTNILIAGLDRRPNGAPGGGGLTDTMVLVVVDNQTGEVGLVSIPRDLYVEIPGHGMNRINAAHGLARQVKKQPLDLLREVVERVLAVPVPDAVVIDLGVFEKLVDAVGGITVDVRCPILDDFVDPRTPTGRRVLDVPSGQVRMDGPTAAMYVRSRHGRSDFSRARRQQAVLSAIHQKIRNLGSVGSLPALWQALESSLSTTFKRYELLNWASRALTLDPSKVHGMVFGLEECHPFRSEDGKAVLLPDPAGIDRGLARLFSHPPPTGDVESRNCPPKDVALQRQHRNHDGEDGHPTSTSSADTASLTSSLPIPSAALGSPSSSARASPR